MLMCVKFSCLLSVVRIRVVLASLVFVFYGFIP